MLITLSDHGREGGDGAALTRYLDAPTVTKRVGGTAVEVPRDPAPEVLMGDPRPLRRAIAAGPFRRRYASLVLSFAAGDVDAAAFDAGDPVLRRTIDRTLRLVLEVLFAGLPRRHRPPAYATTHTHTGRLEINLAAACTIHDARGRARAFNPRPPRAGGRAMWDALQDALNGLHGWADPHDPRRARALAPPDWLAKATAEAERHGNADARPDTAFWARLSRALADDPPADRAAAEALAADVARLTGHAVVASTPRRLTLRHPATATDVVLAGPILAPAPRRAPTLEARVAARAAALAAAPARLLAAWRAWRQPILARHGHADDPDAEDHFRALLDPRVPAPRLIPRRRPDTPPPRIPLRSVHPPAPLPTESVADAPDPAASPAPHPDGARAPRRPAPPRGGEPRPRPRAPRPADPPADHRDLVEGHPHPTGALRDLGDRLDRATRRVVIRMEARWAAEANTDGPPGHDGG